MIPTLPCIFILGTIYAAATTIPVAAFVMPQQTTRYVSTSSEKSASVLNMLLLPEESLTAATTSRTIEWVPSSSFSSSSNMLLSNLGNDINWDNPGQAFGIFVLLAYIGISIAAGLKYIIKDGWRPKL
jgi:hypothetical protein